MEEHSIDVALLNEVSTELLAGVEGSLYELWGTEGVRIMVEVVKRLREIPGVAGAHVMGLGREEPVRRVIDEAGLLPRPG
jgi:methylenetetrahydrofolate reductase (NADPH)